MQILNLKKRPEHINKIAKLLFDRWVIQDWEVLLTQQ